MNKQYFRFLMRYHRVPIIFFFVFYMIIALSTFMTGSSSYESVYAGASTLSSTIGTCMVMSVLLSFGVPIYLFSWMHTKKSCDVYGALPYTRKEELITSLVAAFLVCFGFFVLGTIIPAGVGLVHGQMYLSGYLLTLVMMALGSAALLLFNAGLYLIANNALDGVVMLGAYHVLPFMLMVTWSNVFSSLVAGINSPNMTMISWLSPVYSAGSLVMDAFSMALASNLNMQVQPDLLGRSLFLAGFLVLSIFLLKANFLDRRLERAEQLSDQTLAYPLVIRIYTALCLLILAAGTIRGSVEFLMFILIFAAFMVSQFVYRRTIRPNWKMILQFLILLAAAFVIAGIGWWTRGFGLSERPVDYAHAQSITYRASNDDNDTSVDLQMDLKVDDSDTQAIALLEQLRQKSIDDYYSHSDEPEEMYQDNSPYSYGILSFEINGAYYTYEIKAADELSIDDLRMMKKYGTQSIYQYSYSSGNTIQLTLDQYSDLFGK